MTVDSGEIAGLLETRLCCRGLRLVPLDIGCAWPVFRGECDGRAPVFVKVTAPCAAAKTVCLLTRASAPFLPSCLLPESPRWREYAVLCLEWKTARKVHAEDMTDTQLDSFVRGCVELSQALSGVGEIAVNDAEDDPDRQYAALADYAVRHPFAARWIRPLLEIPKRERSYAGHSLVPIHGDLQPKNYGFDGDLFAAVFDFDDLRFGLACEDAAYAFTERFRRTGLSAEKRQRLGKLFSRMVAASPWPPSDWIIAVNHSRLRIAARRLDRHPESAFVAFDIALRDRRFGDVVSDLRRF